MLREEVDQQKQKLINRLNLLNGELQKREMTDELTGLYNRKGVRVNRPRIMEEACKQDKDLFVLIFVSTVFLMKLNEKVNMLQNTDELTGLYNNRLFKNLYQKNIRKYTDDGEASLFMLDIDDFKHYNDSRGHLFGNVVLKLVANHLKGRINDRGIMARWGFSKITTW